MVTCGTCTLGGSGFNALDVTRDTLNRSSTDNAGKHGTTNFWRQWHKMGGGSRTMGIAARAPYDIGQIRLVPALGGIGTGSRVGFGLGAHGHGIGVVPASLGGPYNPPTQPVSIVKGDDRGNYRKLEKQGFCLKCFSTWVIAGAALFFVLLLVHR